MNVLRCFGVLAVYIVVALSVLFIIRRLVKIPDFVFRKMLHIVAVCGVCLMIFQADNWQAAALTSGLLAIILYPVLSVLEEKPWFDKLLSQKSQGEIKKSMLLLFIMFTAVTAVAWGVLNRPQSAIASIAMWGIGDAAAAMIGIPFGKHKVHCKLTDGKKSWEGSFAMLIASFLAGSFVLLLLGDIGVAKALLIATAGAIVGSLAELFSPSEYDTITVPVTILFVFLVLETALTI
ncbi:MAG: phosphatidate cytidylyltransferase [Lachnospiraceae bacterium]|nr:phosphatidate cytidylyltransferase [Lachnospiraceae bacterium]